jgi:hypothetical protein
LMVAWIPATVSLTSLTAVVMLSMSPWVASMLVRPRIWGLMPPAAP